MIKVISMGAVLKALGKVLTKVIFKSTLIAMGLIVVLAVFTRFILQILFGGLFG